MQNNTSATTDTQNDISKIPGKRSAFLIGGAITISIISVWIALGFSQKSATAIEANPSITVQGETISLTPQAPQWNSIKVGVATKASQHWTEPVPARVRIDETYAARVGTPLAGRVVNVFVELGQTVQKGAPLLTIASSEIAAWRADLEKAEVDLETAKLALERVKAMVAARALPAKEELAATQAWREAEVAYKLAGSKLASLQVSSKADNEFIVIAPRNGVIVEKNVLPAQEVTPNSGEALITVADLSSIWVVAELYEAEAAAVHQGSAAKITSPILPSINIEAKVDMVSSVVDPIRHTVPVRVRIANRDLRLKPNTFAQVSFSIESTQAAAEIPATALVSDGLSQYVYVQEEQGRFTRRKVLAESARGGKIGVLSGLNPGDTVVEKGAILLDNQIDLAQ